MKIELTENLADALNLWLGKCRIMIEDYFRAKFQNLVPSQLYLEEGSRYFRVVCTTDGANRSAWAFIDKTNGDILKSASWKAPAKWARGNLLDKDGGMKSMGPYGPAYLK